MNGERDVGFDDFPLFLFLHQVGRVEEVRRGKVVFSTAWRDCLWVLSLSFLLLLGCRDCLFLIECDATHFY